ncbi:MAG: type II toxin-antitoxin system HicB family antitoxin [Candidatus Aminicenantes bacterium]|nr:type II toxin-antitoxin system HicB family antitoxin [Candidatus Aminicenantes bacterium]
MLFPIVIHKDEESVYGVSVPDLPGCFSAGNTFEEAIESARDAIACHLEGLLLDDEPVPAKAPFEAHRANKDYEDGTWAVVAIDISKLSSKAKRVNITVPARVLAIVDQAAAREGETRSGLLVRAALSYLERRSDARTTMAADM